MAAVRTILKLLDDPNPAASGGVERMWHGVRAGIEAVPDRILQLEGQLMSTRGAAWIAVPVALALSACSTSMGGTTGDPFSGSGGRSEVRIVVENENFYDARIYAIVDGL